MREPVPAKETMPRVMMVVLEVVLAPVMWRMALVPETPRRYWLEPPALTFPERVAVALASGTSSNSLAPAAALMLLGIVTPVERTRPLAAVTLMVPVPKALLLEARMAPAEMVVFPE